MFTTNNELMSVKNTIERAIAGYVASYTSLHAATPRNYSWDFHQDIARLVVGLRMSNQIDDEYAVQSTSRSIDVSFHNAYGYSRVDFLVPPFLCLQPKDTIASDRPEAKEVQIELNSDQRALLDKSRARVAEKVYAAELDKIATQFSGEPNDDITRRALINSLAAYLDGIKQQRGIKQYLVVCDNSNNPPDRVALGELCAYIYAEICPERFVCLEVAVPKCRRESHAETHEDPLTAYERAMKGLD